jgi:hypothetical protein
MPGSRTLLRPGDRERTGGLRRDVPRPDRLPKPGRSMIPGWHPPPAPDHPRSPGTRPPRSRPRVPAASGRPGWSNTAHPCAVTRDHPYREGRQAPCGMHDGRRRQRHGNPGRPCRRHGRAVWSAGRPGAEGGPVDQLLGAAVEGAGLQQVEVEVAGTPRRPAPPPSGRRSPGTRRPGSGRRGRRPSAPGSARGSRANGPARPTPPSRDARSPRHHR